MNIIFGTEQADSMLEKYTVLELDIFQIGNTSETITAYCTVENLPIDQLLQVPELKIKHANMINHYRARQWVACQSELDQLIGQWNGELDSFYQEISARINQFAIQEPDSTWSPVIVK
jgi:hypothetical protein